MSDFKIDDATRDAAIEAANNPTREISIALLTTAATASFGPFAGLAVKLGAPLVLEAVAKRRGKHASEVTDAEVRLTAAELLSEETFEEQAEQARQRALAASQLDESGTDDK